MKPSRFLALSCALLGALLASDAEARSSGNRNNRGRNNTGPYRLIDREGDKKSDRKRDESRNTKKQDDAPKSPPSVAKPPAAPTPRPATVAQAQPRPRPAAATRRPGTPTKTDEAREGEATKLLEQANAAFDKGTEDDLIAGAGILRQLLADYGGTAAASSAQQQLDLLLSHKDYGPIILLAEAQEEFDAQRYRRARNKFSELLERFPNSEQAAEARAKLEEIVRDDLLRKTAYTDEELEDARLWFLAGNIHLENGRAGEAAAAYRRVIEEYPGCRYAVMAEEKLPGARGS